MVKWLPTVVTVVLGLAAMFTAPVQAFLVAHPQAAALLAAVYAIVKGLMPSPVSNGTAK